MKSWPAIFIVIVLLVAGGAYYLGAHKPQGTPETVRPERRQVVEAVYATGEVEPVTETGVSAQVTGRIVDVLVEEGDALTKGAILARMDDTVEVARLAEDEADLEFLKKEFDRLKRLRENGHVSQQAVDAARSQYDMAAARLETDKLTAGRKHVSAPMDGMVLRRDVEPGQTVSPGEVLFWIGQLKPLRIDAEVDEEDIPQVRPGQDALIKADAFPDRAIQAKVTEITPRGDPVNKVFRVRLTLPEDTPLMIGMTVEVNIISRVIDHALTLPFSSVLDGKVYILDDRGKVRPHPVDAGVTDGEIVEIRGGLDGDEAVVLNPVNWLHR